MPRVLLGVASTCSIVAILLISIALGQQSLTEPVAFGHSPQLETVERYYDAVNLMIESGDLSELRQVFDSGHADLENDFLLIEGAVELDDYLMHLHKTMPQTRLIPHLSLGSDSSIIARVTVSAPESDISAAFSTGSKDTVWPGIETFRVAGGRIVERHASWTGPHLAFDVDPIGPWPQIPDRRVLRVMEREFSPSARAQLLAAEIQTTIHVTSGQLRVQLSAHSRYPALVIRSMSASFEMTRLDVSPGDGLVISAGDLLIVAPGSAYSMLNPGPQSASALSVSFDLPQGGASEPEAMSALPAYGVIERTVFSMPTSQLPAESHVTIGMITLGRGGEIELNPKAAAVVVSTIGDGNLATVSGTTNCPGEEGPYDRSSSTSLLRSELHVLCPAGEENSVWLFNPADERLSAWILTVSSDHDTTSP